MKNQTRESGLTILLLGWRISNIPSPRSIGNSLQGHTMYEETMLFEIDFSLRLNTSANFSPILQCGMTLMVASWTAKPFLKYAWL